MARQLGLSGKWDTLRRGQNTFCFLHLRVRSECRSAQSYLRQSKESCGPLPWAATAHTWCLGTPCLRIHYSPCLELAGISVLPPATPCPGSSLQTQWATYGSATSLSLVSLTDVSLTLGLSDTVVTLTLWTKWVQKLPGEKSCTVAVSPRFWWQRYCTKVTWVHLSHPLAT